MKYEVFLPDIKLSSIIKCYVVIYDFTLLSDMFFLPNGGNFIVFNRGITGYSLLHNNKKYKIPEGYSASIKTAKSKKSILNLESIPEIEPAVIILAELLPIGFYKLFKKDAVLLNHHYLPLETTVINKYFSKLYMHKSMEQDIGYLDDAFLQMYNDQNNSREFIEDILERIEEYNYEVTVEELTQEFACSRRTIERQFNKFIGLSPKKFIFVCKFYQIFIEYISDGKKFNDTKYIYNDNAHLNKVFHNIVGLSPSQTFEEINKKHTLIVYQLKVSGV
ncbi:helix-turn-helix transcriptional regulator [Sulfurimonas sediminis]|uniref:Helix-turn-helix transcriptional regulator n=1 Tax=Sulfurimonas sediminis TaxID=2590020 RepID=A0A7M1B1U8_9BACT|nr:AraC family transcriptional regulator [Sulfurimonas sediminis]QOP43486.1 helix-turn-helix transcriptional regulator [Sulfurimonas sediminis]